MNSQIQFFASTPKGLELLLVDELRALGAKNVAEKLAGVVFSGDLSVAYRACLWSRLANRILLPLAKFPAANPEELYVGVQSINWLEHIEAHGTLAVQFVSTQSAITHTLFGAQKVKDAIVDQFYQRVAVRPSVDKEKPQVRVNVHLLRDVATLYIDLSGDSLHKRAYRLAAGLAPIKENLAAAILLRAGWPAIAKRGGALLDPMCGSGTLLIEAAMMAADCAPGLLRDYWGFLGWKQHDPVVWCALQQEASERYHHGRASIPKIIGYDQDAEAIKIAFENIERAGLLGSVHVEKRELSDFMPNNIATAGLVVTNPPYGERLGEINELQSLYSLLGEKLKQGFEGWQAAVLTSNPELGKQMGLRAQRYYALYNGKLACKLLVFTVCADYFIDRTPEANNERRIRMAKRMVGDVISQNVQMFVNRLRKNLKHFRRQAQRQGLSTYRIYDTDLPEYACAIDITPQGAAICAHQTLNPYHLEKVKHRQAEMLAVLPEVLDLPARQIYFSESES